MNQIKNLYFNQKKTISEIENLLNISRLEILKIINGI